MTSLSARAVVVCSGVLALSFTAADAAADGEFAESFLALTLAAGVWPMTRWLRHLGWDISVLRDKNLRSQQFCMPVRARGTNYPIRLLRYWFMSRFIHEEFLKKTRTLTVCEVGVDSGQMLQFIHADARTRHAEPEWSGWTAVDVDLKRSALTACGYGELIESDLESPDFVLPQKYDVVILLHVLEHLREPEKAFRLLVPWVNDGGILIGGFPSHPYGFVALREKQLRKRARPRGHISAFSPKRVRDMAKQNSLKIEFLSGTYLIRKQGLFLENFSWWIRFNLFFGALVPGWPGEIYWMLRKPDRCPTRK